MATEAFREMEAERLTQFKESLEYRLRELLGEVDKTVSGMADTIDTFPDPTDRATLETDRNFMLRIRDRERKLISKIKEALERIEDGTYGLCEACGEPIGEKRLMARPVTTLCIECKARQEKQERVRGT